MLRSCGYRVWACGASALVLAAASQSWAQDKAEPTTVDEIVVTGSNIRGVAPVGNTVQVVDAVQLAKSGKATIADFVRELPANFAGGVGTSDNVQGGQDASSAGANLTGGQGANLRGLGSLSTLVLVNGRRVAAAGQYGDFVDLSEIPVAAIQRVEILQDGASAVYGSDAVGGVMNIILKRGGDGLSMVARVGGTTQGGGSEQQLSLSYGSDWGSGHMLLGYEYNNRGRIGASDRDIYNGGDFSDRGGVDWPKFAARAGTAANIFSGAASGAGVVAYTVPNGPGTGLTVADLTPGVGGMGATYNPWENIDIVPQMTRNSVFASFDQDLGAKSSLYGDLRFSRRTGDYNTGYATLYSTVPNTNPAYIAGVTNNFGVRIDDVGLTRKVWTNSYAANLGYRHDLVGDWKIDATVSYSEEDQNARETLLRDSNVYDRVASGSTTVQAPSSVACALSGLTSANVGSLPGGGTAAQRFCAGLNYATFNPYSTQPLSQAVLDELLGTQQLNYDSWLTQASVKVDGTLADLPGGPMKLAAGLDWRREHIDGHLDFNTRSITPVSTDYGATQRDVAAAYTELALPVIGPGNALPLVKSFDIAAAVRYEHGSGLGDFDTTNPKVGFAYVPVDGLKIRGSWGTSYHAPPMRFAYNGPQPVTGGNAAFMRADLYTAPCNTTLVKLNGVVGTPGGAGNCSFTAIVVSGGAGPTLKPETAETWTLGFDIQPPSIRGLKISASYFNTKINDRIVRIQAGTLPGILSQYFATGSTPYSSSLSIMPSAAEAQALINDPRYLGQLGVGPVQSAGDVAAIVYATQSNLAALKMDGVDLSATYDFPTRAGDVGLFANGTWLFSYAVQGAPGQAFVNQLGQYSSAGNPVRFRSRQGVDFSRGPFSATLTANFVSGYQCASGCYVPNPTTGAPQLATSPVKIDPWTTFDLQVGYRLEGLGAWGSNAAVTVSVINLTDNDPPFIDGGTSTTDALADPYDAANATVIGRTVALTFSKTF